MKLRPLGPGGVPLEVLVTSRGAGGVPLEMRSLMSLRHVHTHVFSRPAVASSFDFSKSNFEVLELTRTVCHIERSGRRSARDAKPNVIATCTYTRVLDYARTDMRDARTDKDLRSLSTMKFR